MEIQIVGLYSLILYRAGGHIKMISREGYRTKVRRHRKMRMIINEMGGKCSRCGYDKNYAALDFHHVDINKRVDVARLLNKGATLHIIRVETRKCILLCSNCHRELHHPDLAKGEMMKYEFKTNMSLVNKIFADKPDLRSIRSKLGNLHEFWDRELTEERLRELLKAYYNSKPA